ncbi:MAG: DUF6270 domain-containing protein [Candidatus Thermoplasmatota archaeon]|nr:DUF6270 domain-containing protein [Candidatus Thermoplasmatota archaeon]
MKGKIAIHGSCVSRDFAEFRGWSVSHYQARSSFATKSTPPVKFDESYLMRISTSFEQRMVRWDLIKRTFESGDATVIIVDLIDERFDVYLAGESTVTRSKAFYDCGILKSISGDKIRLERGGDEYIRLFQEGLAVFSEWADAPIILHRANWASTLRTGNGIEAMENITQIEGENALLQRLYSLAIEELQPVSIVESPSLLIADPEHKWGLAPFHYIPEYYEEIDRQVISFLNQK